MNRLIGAHIHITGIVQGVGFRPFVYSLADRFQLSGWVRNTSAGVDIHADGYERNIHNFIDSLKYELPPLALIDEFQYKIGEPEGFKEFEIIESKPISGAFQPISPDVCICSDCLKEFFDPQDRRYLYPFINCTNCGPRFTIIQDIPYDRPLTTMSGFEMCKECETEYRDPLNRRFHAQPIACPSCGPHIWLEPTLGNPKAKRAHFLSGHPAIQRARQMIKAGHILAIKGLGGFHLACDALNSDAVDELRRRKFRVDKPFALMMPDLETLERFCWFGLDEQTQLASMHRPIVILERKADSPISKSVAPGQNTIGAMLPYTPLHYLLFGDNPPESNHNHEFLAIVLTSGNLSEEPIAIDNAEARDRLASLADGFLLHNRPIQIRCDDSVIRTVKPDTSLEGKTSNLRSMIPIRRARGYTPNPVFLPFSATQLLAVGAELKNTFCLVRERYAFLSQHIGDLENYETLVSFESGIEHFERLFRITPHVIAYDLHPDYLSTRYTFDRAKKECLSTEGVQHHHAHIAACMADNRLEVDQAVIGIALDGTGYGEDGAIWGAEFLACSYHEYKRIGHLKYTRLPGGDRVVKEPWRMALSWLTSAGIDWSNKLPPIQHLEKIESSRGLQLESIKHQIDSGLNAPWTSSMGRLFDAVAALIGIRQTTNYEAQAAIELEALVDKNETGSYPFEVNSYKSNGELRFISDPAQILYGIAEDIYAKKPIAMISTRFHNSIVQLIIGACEIIRDETGLNLVALSGGVWQNMFLLQKSLALLNQKGFEIIFHHNVPTNDGGISLGQAAITARKISLGLMEEEV